MNKGSIIILGTALVLAVAVGLGVFFFVRNLTQGWTLTQIPGAPIITGRDTPQPDEDLETIVTEPMPEIPSIDPLDTMEPWDGASRVNILVMALDYRKWETTTDASRADTMLIVTIDPVTKTAGMFSIPRDMWVQIPGFDYAKINTAFYLGETYKLPGGGPGLASETVEHFLGVPIHYYVQVDFVTFIHLIDEIGGVKVTVTEEFPIYPLQPPNFDTSRKVVLKPDTYLLPGNYALAYARARNTEGADFDRAARQQEVIMGIRQQVLHPAVLPRLLMNAGDIYNRLSEGVSTNLSFNEIMQLGVLALDIRLEDIRRAVISPNEVYTAQTSDGLDILIAIPDRIRLLRDEIFTAGGVASPLADRNLSALDLAREESARVVVMNGTLTEGLAGRTSDYLQQLGLNVAGTANADLQNTTMIILYTGAPYAANYFIELMNISENRIFVRYDPDSQYDIAVVLGSDWAASNPLP